VGVSPGDRVLIAARDGLELVHAFLGAIRLGAIAVPVNPALTVGDHEGLLEDCGARVVVCEPELAARFPGAAVLATPEVARRAATAAAVPPAHVEPGDAAYAQYTSGTTGRPKGAVHRHGDPAVYFQAFASAAIRLSADDVVLSVSKLFFAYGLGNALFFPLFAGACAVLHPGPPRAPDIAGLVRRHSVTVLFAVPTFYARLLGEAPESFATVRVAVSAGEALSPQLAARARALLGCPVLDGLGSTEVGQTFVSNTLDAWRDGTIGRALPPTR
jgi:fatty acid CoA ligase FadD22